MMRMLALSAAAVAVLALPVSAQNRVDDPVDIEELLEEHLSAPYYGSTSDGYGRAQRPIIDQVPERMIAGSGSQYVDVQYFRGIGKVVTDLSDKTLYATSRDRDINVSSIDGEALKQWRPVTIGEDTRLSGAWGKAWNESLGVWVLTFVDKPLYRFIDDEPGQAKGVGNGFYKLEVVS